MSKCRSCGAEIKWIKMASGKSMPVDAKPISFVLTHPGEEKALTLVTDEGKIARGYYDPSGDKTGYTSHFATCPNAESFRKRG